MRQHSRNNDCLGDIFIFTHILTVVVFKQWKQLIFFFSRLVKALLGVFVGVAGCLLSSVYRVLKPGTYFVVNAVTLSFELLANPGSYRYSLIEMQKQELFQLLQKPLAATDVFRMATRNLLDFNINVIDHRITVPGRYSSWTNHPIILPLTFF